MKKIALLSVFLVALNFVSTAACDTPTNFTLSSTTTTSATFTWDVVPSGDEYFVRYKEPSDPTWTYKTDIDALTTTIGGLTPGTLYQIQLATECNPADTDFSSTTAMSFYTDVDYACVAPSNFMVTSTTSSSADLTWDAITGTGVEYVVRYKETGSPTWTYIYNIATNSRTISGLDVSTTYQVQVATECAVDNSTTSAPTGTSFTTDNDFVCTTPTGFTIASTTSSSVDLTWNAVAGTGVEYLVRFREAGTSIWTYIYNISTTSRTISGLDAGTEYQVQLALECSNDNTVTSATTKTSFTTDLDYPCTTPTGFTVASTTSSSADLTWNAIAGTGVEYLVRYREAGTPTWTYNYNISTTSRTISGLDVGTEYQVQLATECSLDNTVTSAITATTFTTDLDYPCTTPTNFTIASTTSSLVDLTWDAITGTGVEYLVRYRKSGTSIWTYNYNISTNSRTITGLDAGELYQVQLATECSLDNTVTSATTNTAFYTDPNYPCTTPTGTDTISVSTNSITYGWDEIVGAEYTFRYKKSTDPSFTLVNDVALNSYTISDLDSGSLYVIHVRTECSIDNVQNSSLSTRDSVLTDYNVDCDSYLPITFMVDSVDFMRSYLSWSNSNPFNTYNVRYRESTEPTWKDVTGETGSTLTLMGLNDGATYYTSIQLDCSNEFINLTSSFSDSIEFDTYECTTPIGFSDLVFGDNDATISWTAVTGAEGYNIWHGPKSALIKDTTMVTTNTLALSGLFAGTNYRYEGQTVCSVEDGLYSSFSTSLPGARNDFTTTGTSPCTVPAGFTSTAQGADFIDLSWTDNGADQYSISIRPFYESDWSYTTTSNPSSITMNSLESGTLYRFRISALCFSGQLSSDWTGLLNVSTTGSNACVEPTGLAASSVTSSSAELDWDVEPSASTYALRYKLASSNTWTYVNGIGTNSYTLTPLSSETQYAVQIFSECSVNVQSTVTPSVSFTTLSPSRYANLNGVSESIFYPNPANDNVSYQINELVTEVQLVDMNGKIVKNVLPNSIQGTIDLSDVKKGLYLMKVIEEDGKTSIFRLNKI